MDVFEFLLEYESFELRRIAVSLNIDAAFSVRVYSENKSPGGASGQGLGRISREDYALSWKAFENGYRITVSEGRR